MRSLGRFSKEGGERESPTPDVATHPLHGGMGTLLCDLEAPRVGPVALS